MTPGANPDALFVEVVESLRHARVLLLDPGPQNIDRCRMAMAQCAERMAAIVKSPTGTLDTGEHLSAATCIQNELNAISHLLNAAAVFRRDMLKAVERALPAPAISIHTQGEKGPGVHVLG